MSCFRLIILSIVLLDFGFIAGSVQAQELPTQKVLPLSLAMEAAQAALAAC